jgi:hypothetical protein
LMRDCREGKRRGDERRQRDLFDHPSLGLNKDPVMMFVKCFSSKCFYSQFASKKASKQASNNPKSLREER